MPEQRQQVVQESRQSQNSINSTDEMSSENVMRFINYRHSALPQPLDNETRGNQFYATNTVPMRVTGELSKIFHSTNYRTVEY